MKEAIEKAIEGGWKPRGVEIKEWSSKENVFNLIPWQEVTSDPLFFQCLGKSFGWEKCTMYSFSTGKVYSENQWLYEIHRFIDHLASGKDAELFFKELLQ